MSSNGFLKDCIDRESLMTSSIALDFAILKERSGQIWSEEDEIMSISKDINMLANRCASCDKNEIKEFSERFYEKVEEFAKACLVSVLEQK